MKKSLHFCWLTFTCLVLGLPVSAQVVTLLPRNFVWPSAVDIDPDDGKVIIAGRGEHKVFIADPATSDVDLVAGNGVAGFKDDPDPTKAQFYGPYDVKLDPSGNIIVADRYNQRIRKIDAETGAVTTLAGTGKAGFSDNPDPLLAQFHEPTGLHIDAQGNIFVCEFLNHRIRKIDGVTGAVTTIAGNGLAKAIDHPDPLQASFNTPHSVTMDSKGNLLVSDWNGNKIRKIDAETGAVTTLAGIGTLGYKDDKNPLYAMFIHPGDLKVDDADNIFICDIYNNCIRRIDAKTLAVTTIAGARDKVDSDNENPLAATFYRPTGLGIDAQGNLLVTTYHPTAGKIKKVLNAAVRSSCNNDQLPPSVSADLLQMESVEGFSYEVSCTGSDNCTEAEQLSYEAVLALPEGGASFGLTTRVDDKERIIFNFNKNRVSVRSKAPKELWAKVLADGGISVEPGTIFKARQKNSNRVDFIFSPEGQLIGVLAPKLELICRAFDKAGKVAEDSDILDLSTVILAQPGTEPNEITDRENLREVFQLETTAEKANPGSFVFPNPATDRIQLSLSPWLGQTVEILIANSLGKVIYQQEKLSVEDPMLTVDLAGRQYANGIYAIQIKQAGQVFTQRFVLTK